MVCVVHSVAVDREIAAHGRRLPRYLSLDIGIAEVIEDVADPARQFDALCFLESTAGDRRGADAQA